MKHITLLDATLREASATTDFALSFKDKVEIARQADLLRLDLLETAPLLQGAADVLFLHTIAPLLSHAGISVPVAPAPAAIATAWDAVRSARRAQLDLRVPVSTVQMEYLYHKKAPAMLEKLAAAAAAAREAGAVFEVSLVDATRAEPDFLDEAVKAAAASGACAVTLCDDAGVMLPAEFGAFAARAAALLPEGVEIGVECSDALGLGAACAIACLGAGATRVRTATAAGPSLPPTASIARLLRQKADALQVSTALDFTVAEKSLRNIESCVLTQDTPLPSHNPSLSALHSPLSTSLQASSPEADVAAAVAALGYSLSAEDAHRVYEEFRRIAARKDEVTSKDLDAIVAAAAVQVPETYALESFVITCGNTVASMANVLLVKDGARVSGNAVGNGPIDAAFHSIEDIVGHHFELDDFQIQTVTEGRAAMGTAIVKLRAVDGRLYSGKGVSTDIVGAAIRAYVDALNKICYAEKE